MRFVTPLIVDCCKQFADRLKWLWGKCLPLQGSTFIYMIERFIPAFYQDTFNSEADAIDATSLDTANMCAGPLSVTGGGRLFVFEKTALIVLPAQKNQYELWLSGVSLACNTAEAARAALENFKTMRGVSSWRVFECADPATKLSA